jgi:hypothetical protein
MFKPKAKFNFLSHRGQPTELPDNNFLSRTRATGRDQFEGLKGRDYINARNLGKVQTSAKNAEVNHG